MHERVQNKIAIDDAETFPNLVPAVGKVGLVGQTMSVICDDLIDLIHSVDPSYRTAIGKVGFMMAEPTVKALLGIRDTAGQSIWTPGYEFGATSGLPDLLLGYSVYINQDVPIMAANAKSILFGNYSYVGGVKCYQNSAT